MQYVTFFDISKQPFEWWWPAIGLAIVAVGIIFVKYVSKWPSQKNAKIIGWVMVAFGLVFTIVVYNSVSSLWADWRKTYERGGYFIVEGVVQDFKPMPYEGHQDECFRLKNEKFCYSDYVVQPGFHQSASHGGPIREGLPVRIAYWDRQILRLDIRADSLPSSDELASYAKTQQAKWYNSVKIDPINNRVRLALDFACLLISLCWNIDWRHYMRYWIRSGPPYKPIWERIFRVFFVACLLGSTIDLIQNIAGKHRTIADFETAALYSLFWIGFFGAFDLFLRLRLHAQNRAATG